MPMRFRAVLGVLVLSAVASASTLVLPPVAEAQTGAVKSVTARIDQALLKVLLGLAQTRYSTTLLGLSHHDGDTQRLHVTSSRVLIAFSNASAVEKGGRYTTPTNLREDTVLVNCGDADLGQIFECVNVSVTAADGKRVKPLQHSAGPRAYRNALGAKWTVRRVLAVYDVRDLANGFSVSYASPDGVEWTFPVSPEDAERELLLKLTGSNAPPDTVSLAKQGFPTSLNVRIEPQATGWRITNLGEYRWFRCNAEIGESKVPLPTLEGNGSLTVNRADFRPPPELGDTSSLWIICTVNNNTFMAKAE